MSKSSLGSLPDDVLFGIFSYCNGDDLRELSGVCQSFRAVSQDDYLWKTIYQKRFDRDPPLLGVPYRDQYDRKVHTGKYNVVWRMSVMPRAQNIFDINFSAETRRRGRISESQLPRNASLLEFGSDYFDFVLPQPIEIIDPFEDVIVQCKCESHEWKTNITL
ncbi:F-box only protein 11, partial [Coemansia sp. RSA 2530]